MKADISNLGELEMAVLEYVWEHGDSDVKTAHRNVGVERGITHNTVQSTFKRLWEKGLLARTKDGHAYVYAPKVSRKQLTELMVGDLVAQVAGADVKVALEAFVNLADRAGDETLEALERLVAARRKAQDK
ncbi:MAG: BlaI/MecI/CopY family transcriptional regulator [Myxococcota bacterium]